ncbi:hypothetical protein D3C71_956790 [compost metagenome]
MRTLNHHTNLIIFWIDLRFFHNLFGNLAIIFNPKRSASGLSFIANHSTNAKRSAQQRQFLTIRQIIHRFMKQLILFIERIPCSFRKIICQQMDFLLNLDKQSSKHSLRFDSSLRMIIMLNVVNIFNKHQIGIHLVEILQKSSMTGRTSQNITIRRYNRLKMIVKSNCIRFRILNGKINIKFLRCHSLQKLQLTLNIFLKLRLNGKMKRTGILVQ